VKVIGPGWVNRRGFPEKVLEKPLHSEWWTIPDKEGMSHNKVPLRKSKRRFPDLPPLKSG
jgi:hypothetical protein